MASSSVSAIRLRSASTSAARFAAARRKKSLSDSPTAAAAAWSIERSSSVSRSSSRCVRTTPTSVRTSYGTRKDIAQVESGDSISRPCRTCLEPSRSTSSRTVVGRYYDLAMSFVYRSTAVAFSRPAQNGRGSASRPGERRRRHGLQAPGSRWRRHWGSGARGLSAPFVSCITGWRRHNQGVKPIRFTRGSRKHRVGKKSAYHVIATSRATITTDPNTTTPRSAGSVQMSVAESSRSSPLKGPTASS